MCRRHDRGLHCRVPSTYLVGLHGKGRGLEEEDEVAISWQWWARKEEEGKGKAEKCMGEEIPEGRFLALYSRTGHPSDGLDATTHAPHLLLGIPLRIADPKI